jgi:hypothetical protein
LISELTPGRVALVVGPTIDRDIVELRKLGFVAEGIDLIKDDNPNIIKGDFDESDFQEDVVRIDNDNIDTLIKAFSTPEERKTIDDEQEEALQTEQQAATSATTSTTTNTTTTSANSRNSMSSGNTTSAAPIEGKEKLPGDKKLVVKPELKNINPKNIVNLHGLDEPFVKELADKIKAEGYDNNYPVLAIGYPNNVYLLLDGNHRGNASKQIGLKAIPAWVIDHQDLQPLLAARFGSDLPDKLSELDKYISVNGKSYSELRENNSHTNNSSSTKSSVRSSATTSTRS